MCLLLQFQHSEKREKNKSVNMRNGSSCTGDIPFLDQKEDTP